MPFFSCVLLSLVCDPLGTDDWSWTTRGTVDRPFWDALNALTSPWVFTFSEGYKMVVLFMTLGSSVLAFTLTGCLGTWKGV